MGDDVPGGHHAATRSHARTRARLAAQALAIVGGWVPLAIAAGQSVALRTDDLQASTASYSLIVACGWAVSMLTLPLMGHLSDKAVARGVSRRALLLVGGAGMVLAFALLGMPTSIPLFAVIWLLAQIPTSLIVTVASSRLADEAPAELRGWASTAAGLGPVLGITIGAATTLAYSGVESMLFLAPALLGFVLLLPALVLRSKPATDAEDTIHPSSAVTKTYPWSLLLTIALAFSGLAVGRIYLVPLIESLSDTASNAQVTALASTTLLIATLGAILGTVISGRLLRRGERSLSVFGWFALAAAVPLAGLALAGGVTQVMALGAIFGFIIGAINAATYGIYLHRYAHRADSGRMLGLIVAAETVPYVIVPLVAALSQASADAALIPVLFALGAALSLAAWALSFTRVRH